MSGGSMSCDELSSSEIVQCNNVLHSEPPVPSGVT
jgi:hypothetical protein